MRFSRWLRWFSSHRLQWIERIIFVSLAFTALYPLFASEVVVSLDGPSHIYNAQLLLDLLSSEKSVHEPYYFLNWRVFPNWTAPIFLAFLQMFLSPEGSEYVFLGIVVIATMFAFRFMVTTKPKLELGALLGFFIVYNRLHVLGFYSMLLALPIAFVIIGLMLRAKETVVNDHAIRIALFALLFLTHGFVFLISVFVCLGLLMVRIQSDWVNTKNLKVSVTRSKAKFLTLLLPVLISIWFVFTRSSGAGEFLPMSELKYMLKSNWPLVLFQHDDLRYTQPLAVVMLGLFAVALIHRCVRFLSEKKLLELDVFLLMSVVAMVLYFIYPNSDGVNGYFSMRFLVVAFLGVTTFIALSTIPQWIKAAGIVVLIVLQIGRLGYIGRVTNHHTEVVQAISAAGKQVTPGATIAGFNVGSHWLYAHISEHAATISSANSINNYEARLNYFPVNYTQKALDMESSFQAMIYNGEASEGDAERIEYILLLDREHQSENAFTFGLLRLVEKDYTLIFEEEMCSLYQLKE